jgi:hypothetical protein
MSHAAPPKVEPHLASHVTAHDTTSVATRAESHAASRAAPSVALVCVDPARVDAVFPHVASLIESAIARGGVAAPADLEGDLRAGRALLWLAWDGERTLAAAITALAHQDDVRLCTVVACGGRELARFGPLLAGLEAYARAEGCTRMRICGRKGWLRQLPDYSLQRVIIEKRL